MLSSYTCEGQGLSAFPQGRAALGCLSLVLFWAVLGLASAPQSTIFLHAGLATGLLHSPWLFFSHISSGFCLSSWVSAFPRKVSISVSFSAGVVMHCQPQHKAHGRALWLFLTVHLLLQYWRGLSLSLLQFQG